MKKIRINGIEGYFYVEDKSIKRGFRKYYLCYSSNDTQENTDVSDLSNLTIYQYNKLVSELNKHCPKYAIEYLEGRFI